MVGIDLWTSRIEGKRAYHWVTAANFLLVLFKEKKMYDFQACLRARY